MNPVSENFAIDLCLILSRSFAGNFKRIVSKEVSNNSREIDMLCEYMSGYNKIVSSIIIEHSDGSTSPITFVNKVVWFYSAGITITNRLNDNYFELYTKFINEWNKNPELSPQEIFNNIGYLLYE